MAVTLNRLEKLEDSDTRQWATINAIGTRVAVIMGISSFIIVVADILIKFIPIGAK